jgi:hypothetical protein
VSEGVNPMRIVKITLIFAGISLAQLGYWPYAAEPVRAASPSFQEVYELVRSNLTGMSEAELNDAAVEGFLKQLESQAGLVSMASKRADGAVEPLLARAVVYDGAYAYIRIGRVESGLPQELAAGFQRLSATNRLAGMVLDLRYTGGQNYTAAGETADHFTSIEQPLLSWGNVAVRSTQKFTVDLPVIVLINGQTSGSAEALAAVLRESAGSVVIGQPSAGRAFVFSEVALSDGRTLQIASGTVQAGSETKLTTAGVLPDVRIMIAPEVEKSYVDDPYGQLLGELSAGASENQRATNRVRRRNESDLIRMHREGTVFDAPTAESEVAPPVIKDPALARALDILRGLALAQRRR